MFQTIHSDTLLYSLSSHTSSTGYFFINKHYPAAKQLAESLCPDLILPYSDFDIGFLKWNSLSLSLSIVLQKLGTNNTTPLIKNLLSEIDILFIDQECLKYIQFYMNEDIRKKIVFVA